MQHAVTVRAQLEFVALQRCENVLVVRFPVVEHQLQPIQWRCQPIPQQDLHALHRRPDVQRKRNVWSKQWSTYFFDGSGVTST
jgi:hypothetical protein